MGPGWSSFAVAGHSIFTQEICGDVEVVACYDADTGPRNGLTNPPPGSGNRSPGPGRGRLPRCRMGGCLPWRNRSGALFDSHDRRRDRQCDLEKDAERKLLTWGFSSSPLVVDDTVIVYAGGADDKGVFAYDIHTGEPRWSVPAGDHSYSSPHLATVAGHDWVLMLTNTGVSAIHPADGKNAWNYEWKYSGYRALNRWSSKGWNLARHRHGHWHAVR